MGSIHVCAAGLWGAANIYLAYKWRRAYVTASEEFLIPDVPAAKSTLSFKNDSAHHNSHESPRGTARSSEYSKLYQTPGEQNTQLAPAEAPEPVPPLKATASALRCKPGGTTLRRDASACIPEPSSVIFNRTSDTFSANGSDEHNQVLQTSQSLASTPEIEELATTEGKTDEELRKQGVLDSIALSLRCM